MELRSFPEADDVVDLLTMRIGTAQLLVAARPDFGKRLSSDQIEQLSTQIEERVHERFSRVERIFLDPTAISDPRARARRGRPGVGRGLDIPGQRPPGRRLRRGLTVPRR